MQRTENQNRRPNEAHAAQRCALSQQSERFEALSAASDMGGLCPICITDRLDEPLKGTS